MKNPAKKLSVLSIVMLCAAISSAQTPELETARGLVFEDTNRNGQHDAGEKGIPDVKISNGRDIVTTNGEGRYEIEVDDDDIVFLLKPRGWQVPMNDHMLPQFYYIHKPAGSPPGDKYPGVAPTGPLPEAINFPLHRQDEPKEFRALLFGDPQPRTAEEVQYVMHDVIEELIGCDASFGVTLGDIMFDDLSLFEMQNAAIALIGIPWYNVIGNHDINFSAKEDKYSDETFESIFGPPYYSFDFGEVHFIVIDDIMYLGQSDDRRSRYTGGLGEEQLQFIANDLAMIPEDQLVVLFMHIPLTAGWHVPDREALYRLLENRPATFSVSAHTHYLEHQFLDHSHGWHGEEPHHHFINVTVSGSWWAGVPDETGIPHTTMRDGSPNGYTIVTFDGKDYSLEFKAARRPAEYQMNVYAPEVVLSSEAAATPIRVNVFAGSSKSTVEFRIGNEGEWFPMDYAPQEDPAYRAWKDLETQYVTGENNRHDLPGRRLPAIVKSTHIWQANLPANPPVGTHEIQVRTTDMFGQSYAGNRIIQVK